MMSRGIIAIGIDKDDELVAVRLTDGNQIVFLASHEGQAIRFGEEDVRSMGRPAYGVRGMDLDKNDYIVGMAVTPKDAKKTNGKDKDGKATEETATQPDPERHRTRLRQTHSGGGIPAAIARWQRRDQRKDHAEKRERCGHHAGG